MELYILDSTFNRLGMIDKFTSLIWTRNAQDVGTFELDLDFTLASQVLLQKEYIIYRKDTDEIGIINYLDYKTDENGNDVIVCRGNFAAIYCKRRLALGVAMITDTPENIIRKLVTDNMISPSDSTRKIPNLVLAPTINYGTSITYYTTNKNLLEAIIELSIEGGFCFRINFNITTKTLTFENYLSVDRSVAQSVNARCIFCKEFENILDHEYTDSNDNYENVAYNTTSNVGTATGIARYETFADTSTDLTVALNQFLEVKTFISTINTSSNSVVYKTNFDLGDYVTCTSKEWNVTQNNRITQIVETYEEQGLVLTATFGAQIPTLLSKIKILIK